MLDNVKKWPGRLRGGEINETEEEAQTRSPTEQRLLDGDNEWGGPAEGIISARACSASLCEFSEAAVYITSFSL